ncbi:uncharacterized protein LDX57_012947 [Aspergillus melleus]|uniref:uncharacterized protein n=2 Tax=Aspergillus melleus TaxID=138277 RepID=UPI001E8DFD54|nr:uncharacterized protein LDX57_012947 [Aspergillus melleus]KAH8435317.1 hypothetical protein LDX57_012947 [Aspergillus melleus]
MASNIPLEKLLEMPAATPPPGVTPNLVDPPNDEAAAKGIILSFWIFCSLMLFIRVYTKLVLIRKFDLSDYSILMAWAILMGDFAPYWLFADLAPGVDQWNLRLKDFSTVIEYFHAGGVLYGCCIFFIKLAILLQFIEIFVPIRRTGTFYWICLILIIVNFVFYFISFFLEVFSCNPVKKYHKPWVEGTCMRYHVLNVVASSVNAVSDIIILVLPQVRIWNLQMPLSRRIAVSAVFLVGVMACTASVVRLAYTVVLMKTKNISYYAYLSGIWTIPELSMGIVVACLPVLPKFIKSLDPSHRLSRIGSSLQGMFSGGSRSLSRSRSHNYSSDRTERNNAPYTSIQRGKDGWSDSLPLVSTSSRGSVKQPDVAGQAV